MANENRCEGLTRKYARRCKNKVYREHNGKKLCGPHYDQSVKTFADAEKRWKDAGEPESDL